MPEAGELAARKAETSKARDEKKARDAEKKAKKDAADSKAKKGGKKKDEGLDDLLAAGLKNVKVKK